MTRRRVGIAIDACEVRVALVEDGRTHWTAQCPRPKGFDQLERDLRTLLGGIPRRRFRRYPAVLAIGPSMSRFRQVEGLPGAADARSVTAALRANAERFFVALGSEDTIGPAMRWDGRWWAGHVDRRAIDVARRACTATGLRFRGAAPAAALAATGPGRGRVRLVDGPVQVDIAREGGGPQAIVETFLPSDGAMDPDAPRTDLARLAATTEPAAPVLCDPAQEERTARARHARHVILAVLASLGAVIATMAPDARLLAERVAPRAVGLLPSDSVVALETALATWGEHARAVRAVARFHDRRQSAITLLAELSRALPASSAILALRVDGQGASLVALTPAGTTLLPPLAALDRVTSAQLVGAVTREQMTGRSLQRVAVTLTFAAGTPDDRSPRRAR